MSKNAKEICLETIKQRVLSLQLEQGRLLDETQLSQEFGISRTPLREVIQRLCGEGYLLQHENRGAQVAPMDVGTMRHFFQAAPMVYAAMARLAAEQATAAQVDALKDVQSRYRKALTGKDVAASAMNNHRFHALIGEMAASPYLMPSLNRLLIDHTRIGHTFYKVQSADEEARVQQSANQHDEMIDAFAANEPVRAVEVTLKHWDLSRDQISRFVSPDPLAFELPDLEEKARAV